MMSLGYEDQLIVNFLKTAPEAFFAEREIARKAGQKRQFRENPDWAKPLLLRLARENILQTDALGHYRIAPAPEQVQRQSIPLAPGIAQALARSNKTFDLTELFEETHKESIAAVH